jgi:Mg-chelatase subunit ChlD
MSSEERSRRWRLVLGGGRADGTAVRLGGEDIEIDRTLAALYDSDRTGGLASSAPNVPRWLGDIRKYFPRSVVQVLQRDAMQRLDLHRLLLEPELLESIEPDVHLVATLLALRGVLPNKSYETAREIVRRVVNDLERRLREPTRQAVLGAIHRGTVNRRPRINEMNWPRTIRENLKNYQPELGTLIAERRFGFGRRRSSLKDVILCIDQSGSMASSVVYSSIFGAVLASLSAVSTRLVVFDTSVVDLTDELHDPVELLFSTQLGGGTDINRAVAYCQGLVRAPTETVMVLISDLFEGGVEEELLKRVASILASGVRLVMLLALSDEGAPAYNHELAAELTALGAPAFACTPELFPELMTAALRREDIMQWAAARGIVTTRSNA